ncbi:MAG: CoB--CoM heterodisulfide reductase iron-sulfur subunit A family protein [Thermodesulfobacteriota bacterium]
MEETRKPDRRPERIGVFLCGCGPNISEAVDLLKIAAFAETLPEVVCVESVPLLCADAGKEILKARISKDKLSRIVVAACSPKEHEHTFRQVLRDAEMNPFLLQMANIREQCAWVITDKEAATRQAKTLIRAAASRVRHHEPLEPKSIESSPDVLVVGAGIAGISAALTLARGDRKVYLVEISPCIGGKAARHEDLFPSLECASCVLSPKFDELLHNSQIELLLLSRVKEVLGYFGNFTVTIDRQARYVDEAGCIGCAACIDVCPVKALNEYNEGLDRRRAIYIPYPGALPNAAVIDPRHCLRFQGEDCTRCRDACPMSLIRYDETDTTRTLQVGAILLAVGFDLFDVENAPRYAYGRIPEVYTSLEFERLANASGPTQGKLQQKTGDSPGRIALIACVGSRTTAHHTYCSAVCCTYLMKFIHYILKKLPEARIFLFHSDLCLPGREAQQIGSKFSSDKRVAFLRMKTPEAISIHEKEGKIAIRYMDLLERSHDVLCDMAILAPAMEASKSAPDTAKQMGILQEKGGFFSKEHPIIAPVSTTFQGIYAAGCAREPGTIEQAVAQGEASAGRILSSLIPGIRLPLEAESAHVDEDLCSGCRLCRNGCIYRAITYDSEKGTALVNEVLCKGCGVCAALCPSRAIHARHFSDEAILSEISSLTCTEEKEH